MAETNNANLLAALNQAIAALNELTAATTNQALSVNVAAPAVTVEASPIPPAPDVTVNFDTASIAEAIATQSDRIAPTGESLFAGMSVLADRVAPTGESLFAVSSLIQADLAGLSAKIAADESTETIVSELTCICTQLQKMADVQSLSSPEAYLPILFKSAPATVPINTFKCDQAKFIIAKTSQALADASHYSMWVAYAIDFSMFLVGFVKWFSSLILGGITDAAVVSTTEYGIGKFIDKLLSKNDFDAFYLEWTIKNGDLVCALYSACSGSDALDNLQSIAEEFSTAKTRELARILVNYILIFEIDAMFGNGDVTISQERIDDFVANTLNTGTDSEWNPVSPAWTDGFDSVDCAGCTTCAVDLSCLPAPGALLEGFSTSLFDGSGNWNVALYPVGTWATVDSAWYSSGVSSRHEIKIRFDDTYTFEVELYSVPDVQDVRIQITDCNNDFIYNDIHGEPVASIGVYQGFALLCQTWPWQTASAGQFTIKIRRVS